MQLLDESCSIHSSKAPISYFTSVRNEQTCHSGDVHFPTRRLWRGSYFNLCGSVEPLIENRNFSLKGERQKGKAKYKGKEEKKKERKEKKREMKHKKKKGKEKENILKRGKKVKKRKKM